MAEFLVPIAISSQLDVTGEERIHAAPFYPATRPTFVAVHVSITGDLPDGSAGDTVSYQYTVGNGYAPLTVTLLSGALPTGLSISSSGLVTGTAAEGDYSWTVRVTD